MRGDLNDFGVSRDFSWRHFMVPIHWALLILGLHAIPGSDLPAQHWMDMVQMDKLLHVIMFAILSSSVFVALGKSGSIRKYKWFVGAMLVMYGIGLEFAQDLWFEEREASIGDIVADGLGVLAGRVLFRRIYGCWN